MTSSLAIGMLSALCLDQIMVIGLLTRCPAGTSFVITKKVRNPFDQTKDPRHGATKPACALRQQSG
jgi:hypothetical protein